MGRKHVEEYVPAEYQKKALREEGLSKGSDDKHKDVKDGTGKTGTFLSSNLNNVVSFNSVLLVAAAFMGSLLTSVLANVLTSVIFKKRRAYQAVNFPENTLG